MVLKWLRVSKQDFLKVFVTQPCPTLCYHMGYSLPGSSVHGIYQARKLEWEIFSSPGNLPDTGITLAFLASPSLLGEFFTIWPKILEFGHWKIGKIMVRTIQLLSRVWRFMTPLTAAHQASLSITDSQNLLKLMSIESGMPSNHLILCHSLLI